jgi:N utilization substance protein A
MNGELLRLVDSIHRDKNIARDVLIDGLEQALMSAARKAYGSDMITVTINRETGEIKAADGDQEINPVTLGRIAAQTAKQVMIQKIREAERDVIFDDYQSRKGALVNGTVQRFEGGSLVVNLGKTEGILPRSEQIPGEVYQPGDRIRVMVLDVRKVGPRVKIILSRTHPDFIRRLFELEVPEVSEKIIEVRGLSREAGARTKIAVSSIDSKVDCIGACVGVRGSRIKNIVDELNGEKIDIVRWNDSTEVFIMACLKPAEISSIELDPSHRRARVIVPEDQLSLAIGKKGQNVRLASKLSGWNIDIVSEAEAAVLPTVEQVEIDFTNVVGMGEETEKALQAAGLRTLGDILNAGVEGVAAVEGVGEERASEIVRFATEAYEKLASQAMAKARSAAQKSTPTTAREILESVMPTVEEQRGEAPAEEDEASAEAEAEPPNEETGEAAQPEPPNEETGEAAPPEPEPKPEPPEGGNAGGGK